MRAYVIASASAFSACLVYVYIYRSHRSVQTHVLASNKLPSLVYLYAKYWMRTLTRSSGVLHAAAAPEVEYSMVNCRLQGTVFRRFCSAAGYGWDYPEAEFRDIPLCFPEFLCSKLLLLLLTDENFRLSPAGFWGISRPARAEVDIRLSATSRSGSTVWESVLTFLSEGRGSLQNVDERRQHHDEQASGNEKQVELRAPWTAGFQSSWSSSSCSPQQMFCVAARFLSRGSGPASGLWMLSVCLAEIEKHKGVDVITSPVKVVAQFTEPLLVPGRVTIRFGENNEGQSSVKDHTFCMEQHGRSTPLLIGVISRTQFN
ncbi:hypothetical protein OJAV_G00096150 [Oryzias javanicus]|uniref:MaoC-like domain-containing protein n=1 Tax=Oryzias javanicus TaxID=123683 RepID=A0A3S2PST7_ORYJA|nr:hypothetical protein OJAV_G00096150 [Oryzias javanicus]